MWGGRFEGGLDAAFEAFNRSLPFDKRLVFDDLEGSAAWARALGGAGVLSGEEVASLESALAELASELHADPTPLDQSNAEDVHGFVENALADKVGDLAKKLHTGRSRNDQVATDLKLWLRREAGAFEQDLKSLCAALVDLAEGTSDLALPGYTHLQRAQPITAGHHALAYAEMFARDAGRLRDALERMNTCPLGSAALAGCAFPIDRNALAADLGFATPTRNSLDAVSDRDHALEVMFVCSTATMHLSRLAEDWIFLASQEAGMLTLGDDVSTGSSLMPQKKNPDALELVRGKCGRVIGSLAGFLATCKGLPLAYDKDLQEDKEALFDTLDTARACTAVTTTVVRGASYDPAACAAASQAGYLDATDVADLLVKAGVPFRDAHERVGQAVRAGLELDVELRDLPEDVASDLFSELGAGWRDALAVPEVLARRDVLGGTAPAQVHAQVAAWKEGLAAWQTS